MMSCAYFSVFFFFHVLVNLTFDILNGFIGEMSELFLDEFLHIGGDEVVFGCWAQDSILTAWMQKNGMYMTSSTVVVSLSLSLSLLSFVVVVIVVVVAVCCRCRCSIYCCYCYCCLLQFIFVPSLLSLLSLPFSPMIIPYPLLLRTGITSYTGVMQYYEKQLWAILQNNNKRFIAWEEVFSSYGLTKLPPGIIIMVCGISRTSP